MSLAAVTAFALPVGRHYEMVSPPYKAGYGVETINGVAITGSAEGGRVEFSSTGTFAGAANDQTINAYLAERTYTGWTTVPLAVPSSRSLPRGEAAVDVSPSLESALFVGFPGDYASMTSRRSLEPHEVEYLVQRLTSGQLPFEVVGGKPLARLDGGPLQIFSVSGTSPSMCNMVFSVGFASKEAENEALLEEAKGTFSTLYELSANNSVMGCGAGTPSLRLVAVGNEAGPHGEPKPINPNCLAYLGASKLNSFDAVSEDGGEVLFTDSQRSEPVCDHGPGAQYEPANPSVLYARLGGERTLRISTPIAADCKQREPCYKAIEKGTEEKDAEEYQGQQPAEFAGASADGTDVFFTTVQPLVTGDSEVKCEERAGGLGEFSNQEDCETGGQQVTAVGKWKRFGSDLYLARVECPDGGVSCPVSEREVRSLVQTSQPPAGGSGEVVGEPLVVSMHGERAYFVAHGLLTTGPNREGRSPVEGADNLYVYDSAENVTRFIIELCSGFERSGEAVDHQCPGGERSDSGLWREGAGSDEAQTTGQTVSGTSDGRFLIFTSYGQLVPDDTDTGRDLYRYDAQTESLVRVSVGEEGASQNGNAEGYNANIPTFSPTGLDLQDYELSSRAISEDGSRIVFGTSEPLSPMATDGVTSTYEWYEGKVTLLATSPGEGGVNRAVITPSGNDVFFITTEGLVAQDADGVSDVYDARMGQGFPPEPVPRNECEDACGGSLAAPAPLLVPGSVSQSPGEGVAPLSRAQNKAVKKKDRSKPRARRGKKRRRAKHVRRGHEWKASRGIKGR